jgi:uncharacterized protein (DUF58 family)
MASLFRRLTRIRTRRFIVLRDGKYLIALTLLVGIAALNTGTNLLYLLFSILLSIIIASGILSDLVVWATDADIHLPERLFAARRFEGRLEVRNRKKRFSTYSVWLNDRGLPLSSSGLYFQKLEPGGGEQHHFTAAFPERGLRTVGQFRLRTSYPFSFFEKEVDISRPREVLVYPRIGRVALDRLPGILEGESRPAGERGEGTDLWNIRAFHPGDSHRMIHWRSTAKVGSFMVREHEIDESRVIAVVFDGSGIAEEMLQAPEFDERFEGAVSAAASLVLDFLSHGYRVFFAAPPGHFHDLKSPNDIYPVLEILAVTRPERRDRGAEAAALLASGDGRASVCLWVSPLDSGKPHARPQSARVIFLNPETQREVIRYDGEASN